MLTFTSDGRGGQIGLLQGADMHFRFHPVVPAKNLWSISLYSGEDPGAPCGPAEFTQMFKAPAHDMAKAAEKAADLVARYAARRANAYLSVLAMFPGENQAGYQAAADLAAAYPR